MKRSLVFLFFACVSVLALVFCCSGNAIIEPPAGYVSGHVVEAGTTNPIDSVRMYLGTLEDSIFTDQTGYYIINGWPGSTTLHAEKDGYQAASAEIELIPDDTITQNFELVKE